MREDLQIDRRDRDISSVLRAMGSMVAAMGSTVGEALTRLNRRSLGSLEPQVKRLHVRLRSGLRSDLSWTRFAAESGSELVTRSVRIFWDGLRLGGDAERISYLASMFAMKVSLLRASRKLVSSTFTFVMIPLHVALLSILLFVTEVLVVFGSKMVEVQSQGMNEGVANDAGVSTTLLFTAPDMDFIRSFIIAVILVLTVANTFAPYAAAGGHVLQALSLRRSNVFSVRRRHAGDSCHRAGPVRQRGGANLALGGRYETDTIPQIREPRRRRGRRSHRLAAGRTAGAGDRREQEEEEEEKPEEERRRQRTTRGEVRATTTTC